MTEYKANIVLDYAKRSGFDTFLITEGKDILRTAVGLK